MKEGKRWRRLERDEERKGTKRMVRNGFSHPTTWSRWSCSNLAVAAVVVFEVVTFEVRSSSDPPPPLFVKASCILYDDHSRYNWRKEGRKRGGRMEMDSSPHSSRIPTGWSKIEEGKEARERVSNAILLQLFLIQSKLSLSEQRCDESLVMCI